jgi:hypothetical protein
MSESDPFAWSEQEKERAREVLENDARTLHAHCEEANDHNHVSPDECREWRRYVKQPGNRPRGIDAEYAQSTVESHVRGDCSHDPDVVGVEATYNRQVGEWVSNYSANE